jgi:hypothetical protein
MVLTTETAVTEIKDEEPAAHAHQH